MKGKTPISKQELQKAIQKYLRSGGRIQRLPDEKAVAFHVVGSKWSNTEVEAGRLR